MSVTYYDLKKTNGSRFHLNRKFIEPLERELAEFIENEPNLNTLEFAKKVMFSHEIKANNRVEGYGDDIKDIKDTIKGKVILPNTEKRQRILNLNAAYKFILDNPNIDSESLKQLYKIISRDLLSDIDRQNMGEHYRTKDVYILQNGRYDLNLDKGIDSDKIEEFIAQYFNFLNNEIANNPTEEYIKSQILHFYFVYIHPYFDVNGRTSRTLSMWYLLNKKVYPYIIFNRGIAFKGSVYDKTIVKSKQTGDLTYFIKLMLETVEIELEKEYMMQQIANNSKYRLSATDYQTILYFLSIKGDITLFDFGVMYNNNNDHKKIDKIYSDMIVPLLDKGILDIKKELTKKSCGITNKLLVLRPIDVNPDKVKNLHL